MLCPLVLMPAVPAVSSTELDRVRAREAAAARDLEESSAQVRAAGLAVATVQAKLATAEQQAAASRGRLAAATVVADAARRTAAAAERERAAAARDLEIADRAVERSRTEIDRLARSAYRHGRLAEVRTVMDASSPRDLVRRAGLLRAVMRSRSATVDQVSSARLDVAASAADLRARAREADAAQQRVVAAEQRARQMADLAAAAAAEVSQLLRDERAQLRAAEGLREQDRRDYVAAQAESAALAARIRAAARRAAAEREAARRRAAAAAAAPQSSREGPASRSRPPRSGQMLWPAQGPMTSGYGYRTHPIYGDRRLHAGIDIGAGSGSTIIAATAGTVLAAYYSDSYGNLTVIDHGSIGGAPITTAYAHQSQIMVSEGQDVAAGQTIGRVGTTGNSTGPHLHFEVRRDGEPVDPERYVERP